MTSSLNISFLFAIAMISTATVREAIVAGNENCTNSFWYHKKCARKGAPCYSGVFMSDGCRKWLACRVSKIGQGNVWDDGVTGRCTRRPNRARLCKTGCTRMGQYCYFEKMVEMEITEINVRFPWTYYTSCRCYQKCIEKVFQKWTPGPSPKVKSTSLDCKCDEK